MRFITTVLSCTKRIETKRVTRCFSSVHPSSVNVSDLRHARPGEVHLLFEQSPAFVGVVLGRLPGAPSGAFGVCAL